MSIPSSAGLILAKVPELDGSNWFTWEKKIKMYFLACGAPGIHSGTPPTESSAKATFDILDALLLPYLFTVVAEKHQYLVLEEDTASAAFKRLKGHFEKSTVGHRMQARREFYDVAHDPDQPIAQYVQAVKAASAKLTAFGGKVEDAELVDVLLMNLHESFHSIRASILMAKAEPTSEDVINSLTGSASASELITIKVEDTSSGFAGRVSQGFNRTGRRPERSDSSHNSSSGHIDKNGFSWCDPTNSDGCHRCGRPGHIAATCMYDMPQHVKDWIMHSRSQARRSPSPPSPHHRAHHVTGDTYYDSPSHGMEAARSARTPFDYDPNSGVGPLLI